MASGRAYWADAAEMELMEMSFRRPGSRSACAGVFGEADGEIKIMKS
jgi:hypothetical protein